jgi:hypothetical protein
VDSIHCQQGAKELVYHPAVLEERMTNFNYFNRYVIYTQRQFSGTNLHADPDGHTFYLQRKCNKRNVFHKLPYKQVKQDLYFRLNTDISYKYNQSSFRFCRIMTTAYKKIQQRWNAIRGDARFQYCITNFNLYNKW